MSKFNKNKAFFNQNNQKTVQNSVQKSKNYNKKIINFYEERLDILKVCPTLDPDIELEVEAINYVLRILKEVDKNLKI